MLPTITTALTGLLLLSNAGLADAASRTWTKDSTVEAPTYKTLTLTMTGYNAEPGQTDDTPDVTASGTKPIPGITAARSQDLADDLPFGTVIKIDADDAAAAKSCGLSALTEDLGYRVITDVMHPRKHDQIDLVFGSQKSIRSGERMLNQAEALGICPGVKVSVIGKVDISKLPTSQRALAAALDRSSSLAIDK